MITFYEWLDEINEIAKYYFNQKTFDKWLPELLEKAIKIALNWAAKNPDTNWRRYAFKHWQEHKEELTQRLTPMAQEIFDYEPGIDYQNLLHRMVNATQQIFQKEPYTRRHIAYADSLGKHPDEVQKRKPGHRSPGPRWYPNRRKLELPDTTKTPDVLQSAGETPEVVPQANTQKIPNATQGDYNQRIKQRIRDWMAQHQQQRMVPGAK